MREQTQEFGLVPNSVSVFEIGKAIGSLANYSTMLAQPEISPEINGRNHDQSEQIHEAEGQIAGLVDRSDSLTKPKNLHVVPEDEISGEDAKITYVQNALVNGRAIELMHKEEMTILKILIANPKTSLSHKNFIELGYPERGSEAATRQAFRRYIKSLIGKVNENLDEKPIILVDGIKAVTKYSLVRPESITIEDVPKAKAEASKIDPDEAAHILSILKGDSLLDKFNNLAQFARKTYAEISNGKRNDKIARDVVAMVRGSKIIEGQIDIPRLTIEMVNEQVALSLGAYIKQIQPRLSGFVNHLYRPYLRIDQEDLVNEGIIEYMSALGRFDLRRNARVQNYCMRRAEGAVMDSIRKYGSLIPPPRQDLRTLKHLESKQGAGQELSPEENEQLRNIRLHLIVSSQPKSNTSPSGDPETDYDLMEQMPASQDTAHDAIYPMYLDQTVKQITEASYSELSQRNGEIFRLYFGLDPEMPRTTQTEIAQTYGVDYSRISQIISHSCEKIRQAIELEESALVSS